MEDEELAFKLVELYVREISKGHEKRRMGLDTILNAYFYALLRISRKSKEMEALLRAVEKEEEALEEKAEAYKPIPVEKTVEEIKAEPTEEFEFD